MATQPTTGLWQPNARQTLAIQGDDESKSEGVSLGGEEALNSIPHSRIF